MRQRDRPSGVGDVSADSVSASVSAADILVAFANTVPKDDGLFADHSLSRFGEELEKFAPHLKALA